MFKIEFETDNAAFQDGDGPAEVARILQILAVKVEDGQTSGTVRDINGNTVGSWSYER